MVKMSLDHIVNLSPALLLSYDIINQISIKVGEHAGQCPVDAAVSTPSRPTRSTYSTMSACSLRCMRCASAASALAWRAAASSALNLLE